MHCSLKHLHLSWLQISLGWRSMASRCAVHALVVRGRVLVMCWHNVPCRVLHVLQGIPYPFNSGSDYLHWRDLVMSGQLTAVVRDLPPVRGIIGCCWLVRLLCVPTFQLLSGSSCGRRRFAGANLHGIALLVVLLGG